MTTLLAAKIFGPMAVIIGVSLLLNRKLYAKSIDKHKESTAVKYISGVLLLFFGLLIVAAHNVWELSVEGLLTLLGWIMFLDGAVRLLAPKFEPKTVFELKSKTALVIIGLIAIAVGAYLSWCGYCF